MHSSSTGDVTKLGFICSPVQQKMLHLQKPVYIETSALLSSGESFAMEHYNTVTGKGVPVLN
jgi:hypothetical protein